MQLTGVTMKPPHSTIDIKTMQMESSEWGIILKVLIRRRSG